VPSPAPKTYMSDIPSEYTPHPGPMQMPRKGYTPYERSAMQNMPRSVQPMAPEGFPMAAMLSERTDDIDSVELQTHLVDKQFNGPALISRDNTEVSRQFLKARSGEEVSEFDHDLRAHMLEIQMAVEEIRAEPSAHPNPEHRDIGLTIPQGFFEQQERMFEAQLREMEAADLDYGTQMEAVFEAQEALFDLPQPEAVPTEQAMPDQPVEEMGPLADPVPESLEHIIEASDMQPEGMMADEMPDALDYGDSLMSPDLLEEEMGEVAEPTEAMEPYPDPFGHYGGMTLQEMYDEPEPEMMDPYMIPGMVDPYMMPGPFGPGPMLDPGPGGPP